MSKFKYVFKDLILLKIYLGIKCRDDTRVFLNYQEDKMDSFIHANYVKSPLLFNDFILTQAPMENTIEDFWRVISFFLATEQINCEKKFFRGVGAFF